MVDKINDLDRQKARRHRKLEKSLVIEVEESVQRVTGAVRNFTNPFTVADKNRHYSMTSGAPVPMEIEMDVLRAEAAGMAAKGDFIGRLQSGEPGSFSTLSRRRYIYYGDLQQEGHPHIISAKDNHCFNCCIFSAIHYFYIVEWSCFFHVSHK